MFKFINRNPRFYAVQYTVGGINHTYSGYVWEDNAAYVRQTVRDKYSLSFNGSYMAQCQNYKPLHNADIRAIINGTDKAEAMKAAKAYYAAKKH